MALVMTLVRRDEGGLLLGGFYTPLYPFTSYPWKAITVDTKAKLYSS